MLRVDSLALAYGATPVLEGASLEVPSGKFVSLVGPSGSGKSSLLRAVIGLQKPLAGAIETDIAAGDIGMLFQDDALLPWRNAEQNVALGLKLKGIASGTAIASARQWITRLGLYGLSERFPRELSGGQRKRVALAQVLAREPQLILMDEPFASLDAIVRARVTQDLVRLVELRGISVLLVTHDLEEALALSDVVYLLSHGPRARISGRYEVNLPRPRDVIKARSHPDFAPLLQRLWNDLSREVGERAA
ncbi:MAG TPA: ABC transporter ATP-binding protein [Stellaceae bacterium]|jgi:NitT/TauT family transport system ATP-binding protein|nr:ABC transporter ATP-binding protein [Stellaceae bacterium]